MNNYVWDQPLSLFLTHKTRGIDTLVVTPHAESIDVWCAGAKALGLNYVLQSDGKCDNHYADPNCTGVMLLPDEPNSGVPGEPLYRSPGFMLDEAVKVRQKTNKPLWISLSGWNLQYQEGGDSTIKGWCDCVDVISFDYYVVNRGEGTQAIHKIADWTRKFQQLSGGKRVVADVEPSDQHLDPAVFPPGHLPLRGTTYRELVQEVDSVRALGADVLYFTHFYDGHGGWKGFDNVSSENAVAMTVLNRK